MAPGVVMGTIKFRCPNRPRSSLMEIPSLHPMSREVWDEVGPEGASIPKCPSCGHCHALTKDNCEFIDKEKGP